MTHYDFKSVEAKWQAFWEENKNFYFASDSKRPKFYVLSMFPYPSGELHVGHLRQFVIGDVFARFKRMQGYNVLHPMGADAFGLPAENAAIKKQVHPEDWTRKNIETFIKNMKKLGLSYDFSRFVSTCSPDYYGKQQELFIELFKKGLIYRRESFVNWDPVDETILANEQVIDGRGWRSGAVVERKKLKQWFFRLRDYAEDLLDCIDRELRDWPENVKIMQKNWIGKSKGALIDFNIVDKNYGDRIAVYTTRPDTIFGASFIGISSDHPLAEKISETNSAVADFIRECQKMAINEESMETMEKRGIDTGIEVAHPFARDRRLPVYVANFILMDYGTGAIFGCPAHDGRDYDFAKKYNLPIRKVIECEKLPFDGDGIAINSDFLDGMDTATAKLEVIERIKECGLGSEKINYRLRDWGFSRQRYWGCPIPVVHCEKCGVVCVKNEDLPLKLPYDVEFSGRGNPLEKHPSWKYTICPECNARATRETDTMDTFIDSSWYFLRYPELTKDRPFNEKLCEELLPIDQYIGGVEHAAMHLIYCRFFTKALKDCGYLTIGEPVKKLFNQGMVCHKAYRGLNTKDWCYPRDVVEKNGKYYSKLSGEELSCEGTIKMSKSKSNVVGISEMINAYGTDSARVFVMSDSPANKDFEWTEEGIKGCCKYINRFYSLVSDMDMKYDPSSHLDNQIIRNTHRIIREVTACLENFDLNVAIAKIREFTNFLEKTKTNDDGEKQSYFFAVATIIKLFSPFAPHLCSELLEKIGVDDSSWPQFDENLLQENNVTIAIQINGKLRSTIEVRRGLDEKEIRNIFENDPKVKKYLENMTIKKTVFIPDKIVNIVI
ncbi:MAG: leucine--tRNA ligase [Rickettsiales bacterium]|jgi:leucyl-tRNA synthetase|nr:leucine--tRNA ligase [Rickettsiales bacterium]